MPTVWKPPSTYKTSPVMPADIARRFHGAVLDAVDATFNY